MIGKNRIMIEPGTLIYIKNIYENSTNFLINIYKIIKITANYVVIKNYYSKKYECLSRPYRFRIIDQKEKKEIKETMFNLFYSDYEKLYSINKIIAVKVDKEKNLKYIIVKEIDLLKRKFIGELVFIVNFIFEDHPIENFFEKGNRTILEVDFNDSFRITNINSITSYLWKKFEKDIDIILEEQQKIKNELAKEAKNGLSISTIFDNKKGRLSVK